MKKLLYIIIFSIAFTLGSCQYALAQSEIDIANQRLDKTLELLKARDIEIEKLNDLVEKLKASQQTPCSVAITAVENALNKLPIGEPTDTKQMAKARKDREKFLRKIYSESLKAQCGWKESEKWYLTLLKISPIIGAILLK